MRVAVGQLEGVAAVEASWGRRLVVIRLLPGNQLTLARLQRQMLLRHLRPREAELRLSGRLAREEGRSFLLLEDGTRFELEGMPGAGAAAGQRVTLRARVLRPPLEGGPPPAMLRVEEVLEEVLQVDQVTPER